MAMIASDAPLTPFFLIAFSALLLAIGVTPVMRRLALQTGTVDKPGARKIHANPVPLLGGAGIYAAFILVLFLFGDRGYVNQVLALVLPQKRLASRDDREVRTPELLLLGENPVEGVVVQFGRGARVAARIAAGAVFIVYQ